MSPTIQDLRIDRPPPEQRLRLIGDIWDSLSIHDAPIPESIREELDRRLNAADADPAAGRPWEEVRGRLPGGEVIRPLIIRPEAEQDMVEGRDWYESQAQGLGAAFPLGRGIRSASRTPTRVAPRAGPATPSAD